MCSDILATLEIHAVNEKAVDSSTVCDKECEPTCCGPIVVLVFFPSVLARECIRFQGALPHAMWPYLLYLKYTQVVGGKVCMHYNPKHFSFHNQISWIRAQVECQCPLLLCYFSTQQHPPSIVKSASLDLLPENCPKVVLSFSPS